METLYSPLWSATIWIKLHIIYIHVASVSALLDASKEIYLEVNADKAKNMFMSRHQNAGQNHKLKTINISFPNVTKFKYLGTTLIKKFFKHVKIKSR
jgi:hypothetical protein